MIMFFFSLFLFRSGFDSKCAINDDGFSEYDGDYDDQSRLFNPATQELYDELSNCDEEFYKEILVISDRDGYGNAEPATERCS